jgi:aminocarboxymuconate-semialdehyde decarboxylase
MLTHLVKAYGADRLVIGSDYPLPAGLTHPIQEVRALALPSAEEEKILSGNARDLLDLAE